MDEDVFGPQVHFESGKLCHSLLSNFSMQGLSGVAYGFNDEVDTIVDQESFSRPQN